MDTNKTASKMQFDIQDGPNANRLFANCEYVYDRQGAQVPVEFTAAIGYTTPKGEPGCAYLPMYVDHIKVLRIEHEDGSGHSFNLYGNCEAYSNPFNRVLDQSRKTYRFTAYYNAKIRKGNITLIG